MLVYIQEIESLHRLILNGEDVDATAIEEVLAGACRIVPASDTADVARLAAAVQALEALIRDRLEEVGEELRRLSQGRQAIKGYNHLRGHSEAQRLYRRA